MQNQTLKRQFRLWTVLLILVPSLLVMAIYTIAQIKVVKQENLDIINQRIKSQELLIDYWIVERVNDVRMLSQSDDFRSIDEQEIKHSLSLIQQGSNIFDSLSYINKEGLFKISTFSKELQYPSVANQPYFQAALAGKEYISDVVIGRNSGLQVINFSSPIFDFAGNFQGLILGSVRTMTLETLLRDNWFGKTGEVYLVNREGTLLIVPRDVNVLIDNGLTVDDAIMKFKITDDAFQNIRLGESGTASWISYKDHKVLGAYMDVPERGWTLIGKINEEEVLGPIYKQLAMMASGTIFLLLLILPLATLITNRIKRPLDWLIKQSELITTEH